MFGRFLTYRSYSPDLAAPDTNSARRRVRAADPRAPRRRAPPARSAPSSASASTGWRRGHRWHRLRHGESRRSSARARHGLPVRVHDTSWRATPTASSMRSSAPASSATASATSSRRTSPATRRSPISTGSTPAATPAPRLPILTATAGPTTRSVQARAARQSAARHLHALLRRGRDQDGGPELRHAHRARQPEQRGRHWRDFLPAAVGRRCARSTPFTLQPFERKTVLLDEQPGIAETGPAASYEFSTTVEATGRWASIAR